jgi:transcription initiation factor IIE alpha subunit
MNEQNYQNLLHELEELGPLDGVSMAQVLSISDELRQLFTWMIRKNHFQEEELATYLNADVSHARTLLFAMLYKGLIKESEPEEGQAPATGQYRTNIRLSPRFRVPNNISNIFDD